MSTLSNCFATIAVSGALLASTAALAAPTASSGGHGLSAGVTVGPITATVGPIAAASGSAPPNYNTGITVLSADESLALGSLAGTAFSQTLSTGVLTTTASGSTSGNPFATGSATIADLSAGLSSQLLFLPAINLLGLDATAISSTSTVNSVGGLSALGSTTIAGLSLSGLGLGGLIIDGNLFINPDPNTVLLDLLGIRIVLNEQIFSGDGMSSLGLTTNALRLSFDDYLLGGRLLNGDVVVGQSFASIDGFMPGGMGAIPEPTTWAMLIMGFGMIGAAMRRRPAMRPVTA